MCVCVVTLNCYISMSVFDGSLHTEHMGCLYVHVSGVKCVHMCVCVCVCVHTDTEVCVCMCVCACVHLGVHVCAFAIYFSEWVAKYS